MSSVTSVGDVKTPSAAQLTNLLPAPKPTSSAGFNVNTTGSNIFFNTSPATNVRVRATAGTAQKAGSALEVSASATYTQPLSATIKLRAALGLTSGASGVKLTGLVGANATYMFPVSPSTDVSVSGDVSANTNGVVSAAATLQASQKLGAAEANLSITAAANAGSPVTVTLSAGANIPLTEQTSLTGFANQGLNGGGFSAGGGIRINF